MYLLISGNVSKVVNENLTVGDLLAVTSGVLQIFRIKANTVEKLVKDENKLIWVAVKEAALIFCSEGGIHK